MEFGLLATRALESKPTRRKFLRVSAALCGISVAEPLARTVNAGFATLGAPAILRSRRETEIAQAAEQCFPVLASTDPWPNGGDRWWDGRFKNLFQARDGQTWIIHAGNIEVLNTRNGDNRPSWLKVNDSRTELAIAIFNGRDYRGEAVYEIATENGWRGIWGGNPGANDLDRLLAQRYSEAIKYKPGLETVILGVYGPGRDRPEILIDTRVSRSDMERKIRNANLRCE